MVKDLTWVSTGTVFLESLKLGFFQTKKPIKPALQVKSDGFNFENLKTNNIIFRINIIFFGVRILVAINYKSSYNQVLHAGQKLMGCANITIGRER